MRSHIYIYIYHINQTSPTRMSASQLKYGPRICPFALSVLSLIPGYLVVFRLSAVSPQTWTFPVRRNQGYRCCLIEAVHPIDCFPLQPQKNSLTVESRCWEILVQEPIQFEKAVQLFDASILFLCIRTLGGFRGNFCKREQKKHTKLNRLVR